MRTHFFIVLTQPKAGEEARYHDWYSNRHVFDLIDIPGIEAAQRFSLKDPGTGSDLKDFLAIYEFSDLDLALSGLAERRGTERMPTTDAIDRSASRAIVFEPLCSVSIDYDFDGQSLYMFDLANPAGGLGREESAVRLIASARQSREGRPAFNFAVFAEPEQPLNLSNIPGVKSRLSARLSSLTARIAQAEGGSA